MMVKRIVVAILFVVLVAGLITSLPATSQNGACQNCTKVGQIKKCNDSAAVTDGTTQGNCIGISATTESVWDPASGNYHTVNCTVTEFYNCEAGTTGCPTIESMLPEC